MLDSNKNTTPEATMPLVTDYDGPSFDEPWKYAYVVLMMMYLSSNSRPDIQFVVYQCSRFTHNPRKIHAEVLKSIFWYLVGTQRQVLTFDPNCGMDMDFYVDADFAVP